MVGQRIVAAVAAVMIVGSLFVVLHDAPAFTPAGDATQLFNDFGNDYVEGYSCHGITANDPCSSIGGECEGFISQSCVCKTGFSGAPCDWGPKVADPPTSYSNTPPIDRAEELKRIAMAYGFSNAIYKEQDQMTTACPGFADDASQAIGTSQIHVLSNDASTHAGASYILPGSRSPSGRGEAIFGFRGTEFGAAITEITGCIHDGDNLSNTSECTYNALKTVMTDLNIQRKDLDWTSPNGTVVSLGYMHEGFYNALVPFLPELLSNASDYAAGAYAGAADEAPIINIVGHSLGGALAQIFASIVRVVLPDARIYLTTFGSPRVGSPTWAKLLATPDNTHILRVVAGDDVVSLIPSSVGLLDSVMHSGPQLTVGWDTVASQCASLVDVTNMYNFILENSAENPYIQCAIDSVSQFHLNYTHVLQPYLATQGYSGYQWCEASGVSF